MGVALGDGSLDDMTSGTLVSGIDDAVQVSSGHASGCVRRATGQVMCWGSNSYGQVGNGDTNAQLVPVAITDP
jgi:serine/threonine-protein kinase